MNKTVYNFTGGFAEIIEIIGIEKAREMSKQLGGNDVYIPKNGVVQRNRRDQAIIKDSQSHNYKELSSKYRLTSRQIRHILKNETTLILPKAYYDMEEIIGSELTLQLCDEMGGDDIYIPSYSTFIRLERNEAIRQEYKDGVSLEELAVIYRLSEHQIHKIINTGDENEELERC